LFLTGEFVDVYETNDYIIVFDLSSDFLKILDYFETDKTKNIIDIRLHTKNYLALYFDYFYGLKDYHNIDSYLNVLENYEFEKAKNFNELHGELNKFINSHNDLHTSIITPGYMNSDFTPTNEGEKFDRFLTYYFDAGCYLMESEIEYTKFDDYLIIKINSFTLNTRELIQPILKDAGNRDIIIDLSCNSGGNIISIIEVLSYLTNNNIPLSFINPITDTLITEYYQTSKYSALDNNFFILTSPVTYSAANLLTSIVKDSDIGIILGFNTNGGSSSITITSLPDGAIITNSSNMTFVNDDNTIIEDGIIVDLDLYEYFTHRELADYIDNLFINKNNVEIRENTSDDIVSYNFKIQVNNDIFTYIEYYIDVTDTNNVLIDKKNYTHNEFAYFVDDSLFETNYKITVTVKYSLNNIITKEEVIYERIEFNNIDSF